MSGLLHLVEAATALTQLVGRTHQQAASSTASMSTSSSSSPLTSPPPPLTTSAGSYAPSAQSFSRRGSTHTISDDDDIRGNNTPCTKMAALRENHLEALRVAAFNAGMIPAAAPAPTPQQPQSAPQDRTYTVNRAPRCEPLRRETASPDKVPATSRGEATATADVSKEVFPMRLHALLSDPTVRDVISWLPHGKSFVVLRPDVFATRVLPRYFAPEGSNSLNAKTTTVMGKDGSIQIKNKSPGVHKYPSFTRKLNRWGFRQISRGPDAGAFCHEMFQREDPGLCRNMVCQKSRKSKRIPSAAGGGMMDDMMSVSSASTMGTKLSVASGEKRPYSSTVTVSTAGATSNKSLPFKKRKSGQMKKFMMNDIPSMISHRYQKMPASTSSVTESDLTSDNGSVCSNNMVPKAPLKAAAAVANHVAAPVANHAATLLANHAAATEPNQLAAPVANGNPADTPETTAMQALARHFQEQHRAFALASLMENSRLAMEAAGMNNRANNQHTQVAVQPANQGSSSDQGRQQYSSAAIGAVTTHSTGVFAATVNIPEEKKMPAVANPAPVQSAEDAAKSALYQAYLQALSGHSTSS